MPVGKTINLKQVPLKSKIQNQTKTMNIFEIHPWQGTQHCLRDCEGTCWNDHTGCLWNDGHNECGHPAPPPEEYRVFDSPLLKKAPLDSPEP